MEIKCTLGILTYNSEENLERCLKSAVGFAELIIADGGSTDRTVEIATQYGARVVSQSNPGHPITDFAQERNILLAAATQKWFFYLDSDEIVTQELKEFIRTISSSEQPYQAYRVRYLKTNEDGSKEYRTYREYYQTRLFRTDIGARFVRPVHERIELPAGTPVGQTEAPWYVTLDADYLSLKVFAGKAWKRTRVTALSWKPKGPLDILQKVVVGPFVDVLKSLYKIVMVRVKWGSSAIPTKYELLRILYTKFLAIRNLERVLGILK
jgi:glycosyltransferase involved in cell wall biosynthesis